MTFRGACSLSGLLSALPCLSVIWNWGVGPWAVAWCCVGPWGYEQVAEPLVHPFVLWRVSCSTGLCWSDTYKARFNAKLII